MSTINPDGSGNTTFLELGELYGPAAPNPAVAGQIVFAYRTSLSADYKIYKGSSLDPGSATVLVSGELYDYVSALQVTSDGTQVVFTASRTGQTSHLRKVAIGGATSSTILDANECAMSSLNWSSDKVAYVRVAGGDGDIFIRGLGTSDTPVQLTNNTVAEELWPQFSKNGTKVVFSSDRDGLQFDLYTINIDATGLFRLTSSADLNESSASWSPTATQLSYSAFTISGSLTNNGLYRINSDGTGKTQIRSVSAIGESIYWTSADGRARSRVTSQSYFSRRLRR